MKTIYALISCFLFAYCAGKQPEPKSSIEWISNSQLREVLFKKLNTAFDLPASLSAQEDTMAFLILPVHASCPSCRKKTIDSIMVNINHLPEMHYILIASNGGRKSTNSFFREQHYEMPPTSSIFLLDSSGQAASLDLYTDKPTIYYAVNAGVFKKVSARPSTVREDLREFFSGYRLK